MDERVRDYLAAALWSAVGDDGEPLDRRFGIEDFAVEAVRIAERDILGFWTAAREVLDEAWEEYRIDATQAAHDLWFTANGHGVGFWDGDWGRYGDALTAMVRQTVPAREIEIGDDGRLYFFGGAHP